MFRVLLQPLGALLCLSGAVFAVAGSGVWLDVPFIKQEKDGCGAASIAMVMQYWQRQDGGLRDVNSDPADIQRALYSSNARGIFASDMVGYFRKNHFRTYTFRGEWSDLKENLARGRPLIVALKPRSGAALHYVVVAGMEWEQNVILLNDAAQRKLLKMNGAAFVKEWSAMDDWTLLAMPEPQEQASLQFGPLRTKQSLLE
jgi:ABC-type bacteriocin/lantibiotic exporter with double-glycine peptidase domain